MKGPEKRPVVKRRGFSLVEVLVALALLALLVALAASQQQGARRRATAQGLAEVVAQHLRNAQSLAVVSGTPVALIFPSNRATTPFSQGCYRLSGRLGGQVAEVMDFSKDFPGFSLFIGGVPRGASDARPLSLGLEDDAFALATYQLPYPQDFALIFLPSGQVVSNGIPHVLGDYHLVACLGGEAQARNYPQPDLPQLPPGFELRSACQAHSITLSSLGQVWTQAGPPGGVRVSDTFPPFSPGSLPRIGASVQDLPVLESIGLLPDPSTMVRPAGVDSLVPRDGILTLEATASSPRGLDLFVRAEDVSRAKRGAATSDLWFPMSWDASTGRWKGQCHWRPPADAQDLEHYQLQLRVRDSAGNLAALESLAAIDLQVTLPRQRMTYWPLLGSGSPSLGIHTVEEDATRNRRLTEPPEGFQDILPSSSPDGLHLVYHRRHTALALPTELRIVGAEGSDDHPLVSTGSAGIVEFRPSPVGWSPSGNRIAFSARTANGFEVFSVAPDGSNLVNLSHSDDFHEDRDWVSGGAPDLAWTEDEQHLITCQKERPGELHSFVVKVASDASGVSRLYSGSEDTSNPTLSPGLPSSTAWVTCLVHFAPRPQYCRMKIDGSEFTPLGVYCAVDRWHRAAPFSQHHNYAAISPDCRRISVIGCDANGNGRGLYEGPAEGPLALVKGFAVEERMRYLQYLDPARLSYQMPDGLVWLREVGSGNERALLSDTLPGLDASSWCLAP